MKSYLTALMIFIAGIGVACAAVNINTASVNELDAVKGIGPSKAKAIVEYRSKNGQFHSVDDLKSVKGFGEKSVAKLRAELSVSEGAAVPVKAAANK